MECNTLMMLSCVQQDNQLHANVCTDEDILCISRCISQNMWSFDHDSNAIDM